MKVSSADVVVVGSGPSGAIAAIELVEKGLNVVLLDAGLHVASGCLVRVKGHTVFRIVRGAPETDRHVAVGDPTAEWHSSRTQGGLSNYWTAAVPRFHPADFTEGVAVHERYRWPLEYHDLESAYARVERLMKVTGFGELRGLPSNVRTYTRVQPKDWTSLAEEVQQAGLSLGVMPMAVGAPTFVAARTTGWNSFHSMVKPLLDAPNFTLVRGAEVVRLHWSGHEGRVVAVEYADRADGRALKTVQCRAVVLAAGTVDSTRILLQSRSPDFPNGLGNTDGLVGRFLCDHPREWWPVEMARPLSILAHPMYVARAPHGAGAPLFASSLTIGAARGPSRVRSWYGGSTTRFGVQVFGTMVPQAEHTIELPEQTDGADSLTAPVRINIRYDAPTLENMLCARRRFEELFAIAGIRATPIGPFHDLVPGSSVHYAGTVRMHTDKRYGVLDGYNRIHDAPNVIVTDMSCFTTNPEKNPTLTAMALSSRAALKLAESLR